MATQLEIVNNVLEELREDTVETVSENSYSKLIALFVNKAKRDLESVAFDWAAYITVVNTSILGDSATTTYVASGTNEKSWLMRQEDERIPMAFVTTSGYKGQMFDIPYDELLGNRAVGNDTTPTTERPEAFSVVYNPSTRVYNLEILYPNTNAVTMRTMWYVPQADLDRDGTDDDTEILLPASPIESLALFYAQNERGEEMGQPNGLSWARAQTEIAAALETNMQSMQKYRRINVTNCEYL